MFTQQITAVYPSSRVLLLAGWILGCGLVWGLTGCEDVSSPAISSTSSPTKPSLLAENGEEGGSLWEWLWEGEQRVIRQHLAAAEQLVYQDKRRALAEAQQAHRLSVKGEYPHLKAESRYWMALVKKQSAAKGESLEDPLSDANISLRLFRELDDPFGIARSLNLIGVLHYRKGRLTKAATHQLAALDILTLHPATTVPWQSLKGEIHHDLGNVHYDLGQFVQANEQYGLSEIYYQQLGLDERQNRLLIDMGHLASAQDRGRDAEKLYEAALAFGRKARHQELQIKAYEALGMLYMNRFRDTQSLPLAQASHQALHAMLDHLTESHFRAYYQLGQLFHLQAAYLPEQFLAQNVDSAWHYYLLAIADAAEAGETHTMAKVVDKVQGLCQDPGSSCHAKFVEEFPDVQQEHYEAANRQLVRVQREADNQLRAFEVDLAERKAMQRQRFTLLGAGGIVLGLILLGIIGWQRLSQQKLNQRLKALRAQINPHFVANTISAIETLIQQGSKDQASSYLIQFARLNRQMITASRRNRITLSQEVDLLKSYLRLMKLRLEDDFDYSIDIATDLKVELLRVPSMIVQPFVENAIFHGIRPKEEPGQVSIRIQKEKQGLLIVVDDDGIGRAAAAQIKAASAMHATPSYGIRITQERLQQWSAKRVGIQTIDKVDRVGRPLGTRVEIRLPYF